jgi:hypothetical protein
VGATPRASIESAIAVGWFAQLTGMGSAGVLEEASAAAERLGDRSLQAQVREMSGDVALARSDHAGARAAYDQALTLYQRIPEPYSIGLAHCRLARIAGSADDRRRHVRAAEDAWSSIDREDLLHELAAEFTEDS